MNIRKYIQPSALFLEGVENLTQDSSANVYCGFNVTKTDKEPIDQLQAFIIAKRIQEYNLDQFGKKGTFIAFIGGLFEVLNCRNVEEVDKLIERNKPKEESKKKLFQKIYEKFELEGRILTTEDLWQDQKYWEILKGLFDKQVFTRGLLINDTLNFYQSKEQLMSGLRVKDLPSALVNLPLEFIKKIGNFPAPILYTPAEVSEAYYLKEKYGISIKIGQTQERTYDKYLYQDFSVFRLKQPVSLSSSLTKPEVVTPYIDKSEFELSGAKKKEVRLYFEESLAEISQKVSLSENEKYVYTVEDIFGEVINPIVEKAILAIESAKAMGIKSVCIANQRFNSGQDLIDSLLDGSSQLQDVRAFLPKILNQFVIKPFS
ncbi:hypothetical protein A2160_02010 [Candidatus Beckwithbacteria bacterium RBG_13_42_9]|uniref:Uncharacterized protein n=1 Tax=Candidatus Beckwithbacteria bacterium RBG_13_42_9 TaxID=1797457 RepID=A0A1F5E884_9BACT|nr:MAG: hypothetical protein A2160_02010 [Candidatus Beckwithbacteria bacterium RBG_13_42_9]